MKLRARHNDCTIHADFATFRGFLLGVPRCPGHGFTLDRIDTFDREYAPSKVRWLTAAQQANNRPNTIMLPYRGEMLPLTDVARLTGQKPNTMRKRLRQGWASDDVVAGERRLTEAPRTLSPEGWPAGTTVGLWEGPYQGWRRHPAFDRNRKAATRAVFFLWIAGNARNNALAALAQDFPELYDPGCGDPDPTSDLLLPPGLEANEWYKLERGLQPMLHEAEVLVRADPAQYELLNYLRNWCPPVTDRAKARAAMDIPRQRRCRLRSG